MLLAANVPAQAGMDALRQQAENFAGREVVFDPRLTVPDCIGGYAFAWSGPRSSALAASCPPTGWRIILPLQAAALAMRRGQTVRVEAAGQGFRVGADVIAEGRSDSNGNITVRNSRSGRSFSAVAGPDGQMILPGSADQP